MSTFFVAMLLCGVCAGVFLSWIFVALAGFFVFVISLVMLLLRGMEALPAMGYAIGGCVLLQAGFFFSGWGINAWQSSRPNHGRHGPRDQEAVMNWLDDRVSHGGAFPVVKQNRGASTSPAWPIFGGWLPLVGSYTPPCQRDGSPWNGVDDPGYRVRIYVLGWFGRAIAFSIGKPARVESAAHQD